MTTKEKLAHLNKLRIANNEKPINVWKESTAKLDERIRKYEVHTSHGEDPVVAEIHRDMIEMNEPKEVIGELPALKNAVKSKPTVIRAKGAFVKELRQATKQEVETLIAAEAERASSTVTLVMIAKELNINPRVARAKMRRVDMAKLPADAVIAKHTYKAQYKDAIINALRTDFRKK